jgi:hypothetical protein
MVNTWLGGPRIFYTWNTEESWEVWLSAFHRSTDYKLDATVSVFKKKRLDTLIPSAAPLSIQIGFMLISTQSVIYGELNK